MWTVQEHRTCASECQSRMFSQFFAVFFLITQSLAAGRSHPAAIQPIHNGRGRLRNSRRVRALERPRQSSTRLHFIQILSTDLLLGYFWGT